MFYKAKADLHLHTEASDGILTPSELVREAKAKELKIISITDHDTIAGVEEAIRYGNKIGVKVIPGIELSTMHNGESIHILGYFKGSNYKDKNFRRTLEDMTDFRISRGQKIVNNLERHFGIRLNYENILKEAKGVIARPHIAKAIVDSGYNYDWEYIFHNIIGEDSPAYVPKKNLTIQEGIDLLKSVNALAVLAHPIVYKKIP
jgi:predicted metal-dependent phosphoesterase TrpH